MNDAEKIGRFRKKWINYDSDAVQHQCFMLHQQIGMFSVKLWYHVNKLWILQPNLLAFDTILSINAFLRRGVKCGLCPPDMQTFEELCLIADDKLFKTVLYNNNHVLHKLLPPQCNAFNCYNFRKQTHDRQLPDKHHRLTNCNFINRVLYIDAYWLIFMLLAFCRVFTNKRIYIYILQRGNLLVTKVVFDVCASHAPNRTVEL